MRDIPYLARVASNATIDIPTQQEMERIAAADARFHRKTRDEVNAERYALWTRHMEKNGFKSEWRVGREDGRILAHIWFVVHQGVATVLVVGACCHGPTKIQVAAMLLDGEREMLAAGAHTVCYLTQRGGTLYDEAYDACGYEQENDPSKLPPGAYVIPQGLGGEPAAVRWRRIDEASRIGHDRMKQAQLCLSAPTSSTPS